jgi:hypothetical protein
VIKTNDSYLVFYSNSVLRPNENYFLVNRLSKSVKKPN